jgi:hypothetical protein
VNNDTLVRVEVDAGGRDMRTLHTFALAACAVLAGASVGRADTRVTMRELPPAVQKTVKEQSQGATLRGLSKEVEHGRTIYEAELEENGHGRDVIIDRNGAVVAVEDEVALDDVPGPVKAAIVKRAGGGTIRKVEATTRGNVVVEYEAHLRTAGGKAIEVRLDPDGNPKR